MDDGRDVPACTHAHIKRQDGSSQPAGTPASSTCLQLHQHQPSALVSYTVTACHWKHCNGVVKLGLVHRGILPVHALIGGRLLELSIVQLITQEGHRVLYNLSSWDELLQACVHCV